ncbi:MAG: flotillin family protein [Myxococcales bacterium]|nr:flotillin family protein [Myxococcales bacterium]
MTVPDLIDKVPPALLYGVSGGLAVVLLIIAAARSLLHICPPNQILIFSGRNRTTGDGRAVGFRVVHGGRGWRVPVIESVRRMDVANISVPMSISGAYSEGGIPLTVNAVANVKVTTDPRFMGNAIERFMDTKRAEIGRVAKETLEGHLREVLSSLTPEEVNEDRLKFAKQLLASAERDLQKLGLHLDTLKIQHVADDRNYLESIGRQRLAEILRVAEVAESDAMRTAQEAEAAAGARAQVAITNAEAMVQQKQNELRQIKAELDGQAASEEQRAEAAAHQARAEAEKELQEIRGELEQLRLAADVTIPAEIERQVRELLAAGQAATISADGEAMARALAEVAGAWRDSQGKAMDMFVLQNLDAIFGEVTKAARRVKVDEVNLVDGGDGATLSAYAASYPAIVGRLMGEVQATLGIDISRVITGAPTAQPALAASQG